MSVALAPGGDSSAMSLFPALASSKTVRGIVCRSLPSLGGQFNWEDDLGGIMHCKGKVPSPHSDWSALDSPGCLSVSQSLRFAVCNVLKGAGPYHPHPLPGQESGEKANVITFKLFICNIYKDYISKVKAKQCIHFFVKIRRFSAQKPHVFVTFRTLFARFRTAAQPQSAGSCLCATISNENLSSSLSFRAPPATETGLIW